MEEKKSAKRNFIGFAFLLCLNYVILELEVELTNRSVDKNY